MRHALIIAGGSGSRLWPLSREGRPKQFLPMADGRSLLEHAWEQIDGLVDAPCRWVCADESLRQNVISLLPGLDDARFLGEPVGKDTLAALAFSCTIIEAARSRGSDRRIRRRYLDEPPEALRLELRRRLPTRRAQTRHHAHLRDHPHIPLDGIRIPRTGRSSRRGGRLHRAPIPGETGPRNGAILHRSRGRSVSVEQRVVPLEGRTLPEPRPHSPSIDGGRHGADRSELGTRRTARHELSRVYSALPRISVDHGLMEPATSSPGQPHHDHPALLWSGRISVPGIPTLRCFRTTPRGTSGRLVERS